MMESVEKRWGFFAFWHDTWQLPFIMIWAGNCPWCVFQMATFFQKHSKDPAGQKRWGKSSGPFFLSYAVLSFCCPVRCESMGIVPVTELKLLLSFISGYPQIT